MGIWKQCKKLFWEKIINGGDKTCICFLIQYITVSPLYSIWGLLPVLLHVWSSIRDQY